MCEKKSRCCKVLLGLLGKVYKLYFELIVYSPNSNSYPCFEDVICPIKYCIIELLLIGKPICCEGVAESIELAVQTLLKNNSNINDFCFIISCICETSKAINL